MDRMKTVAAPVVANRMNSNALTENAFSRPGVATVKMIAVMVPMKKAAQLLVHHPVPAVSTNSNAPTDNVFQNLSNVTRNQTAVTTPTKLDVLHLPSLHPHPHWLNFKLASFSILRVAPQETQFR
jgi:hypothetical protein